MTQTFQEVGFLTGVNSTFLETLYLSYVQDPSRVDPSWARYFASLNEEDVAVLRDAIGASWAPRQLGEAVPKDHLTKSVSGG